VIFDEDASDQAIRSLIKRARNEMRAHRNCGYEIKAISKKGYKLEGNVCQIVAKTPKVPAKEAKK
jgi:DNA-binding winged helix-turn-helix (wHTH) protein